MSTDQWDLTLSYHRPPLSLNDRNMHWGKKSTITRRLRTEARQLAEYKRVPPMNRIHVTLCWQPDTRRPRDLDNPVATLKPCIDGLRDAGVITDDDSTRVTSEVRILPVTKGTTARIWLEIRRVA